MSFFQNTCKPKGFMGALMLNSMNLGHKKLHDWGFKHLNVNIDSVCLDIGCGGGSNLKRLLKLTQGKVYGIDYSEVSVKKSRQKCKKEIASNRCDISTMDVLDLKFPNNTFSLATAFETIYFWQDLDKAFQNIYNILEIGGTFFICNAANGKNDSQEKWCKIIKGMKIYKVEEIKAALFKAGFKKIGIDDRHKSFISIKAIK